MTAVKAASDTQEWNIKSCKGLCHQCDKAFAEDEDFITCLNFGHPRNEEGEEDTGQPPGYIRHDYCLECWSDELKQGSISSWKTFYKPPPPPKEEAVKKETAESVLRGLLKKNKPNDANTIFVLAVMLERKKDLIEKEVQKKKGGKRIRVYEHKVSGDTFLVTDPDLRLDELEKVQAEVAELLGWNKGRLNPELVEIESFLVCGQNLRTRYKYEKESKTARIPAFWAQVHSEKLGVQIPAVTDDTSWYGLYHRYEKDYRGAYTLTAALPVKEAENVPDGLEAIEVPSQAYYKFELEGPMPETIAETWPKILKYFRKSKDFRRAYKVDFEKYTGKDKAELYVSVLPIEEAKQA